METNTFHGGKHFSWRQALFMEASTFHGGKHFSLRQTFFPKENTFHGGKHVSWRQGNPLCKKRGAGHGAAIHSSFVSAGSLEALPKCSNGGPARNIPKETAPQITSQIFQATASAHTSVLPHLKFKIKHFGNSWLIFCGIGKAHLN